MLEETRELYTNYVSAVAALNNTTALSSKFNVTPQVAETMEKHIQESDAFLGMVNVVTRQNQSGRKIGIGVTGTIAGRTDVSGNGERTPPNIHTSDERPYMCQFTEYDTGIDYETLDMWRHNPQFETLLRDSILNQVGQDRIMIGFNGTAHAVNTDRAANPLLQDVNIGWLQAIRDDAASQHHTGIKIGRPSAGSDIATQQDFYNLDQCVLDAKSLLHSVYRGRTDLVVICGTDLVSDKYTALMGASDQPSENAAANALIRTQILGGLPVQTVPHFPEDAFLITPLKNLSIYVQEGTRRRMIKDKPEKNRIEDFNSLNECFVVEAYKACAFVEGIKTPNADHSAWA